MLSAEITAAIDSVAREHHGLVSNRLVRPLGVTPRHLQDRCRQRSLVRIDQGLYRVERRPPGWRTRLLAAVWLQGHHAAASHRSAAWLHGLRRIGASPGETPPVEVVVPRWDSRPNRTAARIRDSGDLLPTDIVVVDAIPCTTIVRTLIDLPAVLPEHWSAAVLDEALTSGLCTIEAVADRFVQLARRGRNGTHLGRRLISERLGRAVPTRTDFEQRLANLVEDAGLPSPARQVPVRGGSGTIHVGLGWPDLAVGVECAGLTATRETRLAWEHGRDELLRARGWKVLAFTWHTVTTAPESVVHDLCATLARSSSGMASPTS